MPQYLEHLQAQTDSDDSVQAIKAELATIANVAVAMRALLSGAESLGRCVSLLRYEFASFSDSTCMC